MEKDHYTTKTTTAAEVTKIAARPQNNT